jgi:hypothetical protein
MFDYFFFMNSGPILKNKNKEWYSQLLQTKLQKKLN